MLPNALINELITAVDKFQSQKISGNEFIRKIERLFESYDYDYVPKIKRETKSSIINGTEKLTKEELTQLLKNSVNEKK